MKTVKLAGIGQNEDTCDKEQEEEMSLLRSQGGQASHEGLGEKMKDSNQEEMKDKEEEHEEHSEDLILTDTEMTGNLKDSKQDTNSQPTNLKDSSVESAVKDSTLVTKRMKSNLAKSMVAELQIADLKLHNSAQLLCDMASSEGPGFPIKQSRKRREPECCFFPPSSDKYSFLFKPDFLLLSVSFLFLAFGYSMPFMYLVPYSLSMNISQHQAILLMSILGVMGSVGNITSGWISDRK